MFKTLRCLMVCWAAGSEALHGAGSDGMEKLAEVPERLTRTPRSDWLLAPKEFKAGVYRSADAKEIVLNNG